MDRAIGTMCASQANDGKMTDGKALALICQRWLQSVSSTLETAAE